MVLAWFMDSSAEDQRLPHQLDPPQPVSLEYLASFGVLHWHVDADTYEANPTFQALKRDRGYTYTDKITISPDRLPDYEKKLKTFFEEHLHTDEEIRFILEGSGYFDVRDRADRWVRIAVDKGDILVLPAGLYHRFTLDDKNYLSAMRLFVGDPVWTPWNRKDAGVDEMPARKQYISA